jgi:hypothetical protein
VTSFNFTVGRLQLTASQKREKRRKDGGFIVAIISSEASDGTPILMSNAVHLLLYKIPDKFRKLLTHT